jgi:hypothetical protein
MRISKLLLICLCCLMAATVWGQAANGQAHTGILGYLDPRTGAFRPIPPAAEDSPEVAALTTFTGKITVTLTITIKSTGITSVNCTSGVSVLDALTTSARVYEEVDEVAATGTGATRTCKLSVPYSWSLSTPASDTMSTVYSVSGSGSGFTLPIRESLLSPLDTRKVPPNGATTALTANVTI